MIVTIPQYSFVCLRRFWTQGFIL